MHFTQTFNLSYEAKNIRDGDEIPVGTVIDEESGMPTGYWARLVADYSKVGHMFDEMDRYYASYFEEDLIIETLAERRIGMDPETYMRLWAATACIRGAFSKIAARQNKREHTYSCRLRRRLSKCLESGTAACTEFSLLAQGYLQKYGIDSKKISGGAITRDKGGMSNHAFIIVNGRDGSYVFDPSMTYGKEKPAHMSLFSVNGEHLALYDKLKYSRTLMLEAHMVNPPFNTAYYGNLGGEAGEFIYIGRPAEQKAR